MLDHRLIVRRVLRAGFFEPPPVMVEDATEQMQSYAASEMLKILRKSSPPEQFVTDPLHEVAKLIQNWIPTLIYQAFELLPKYGSNQEISKSFDVLTSGDLVFKIRWVASRNMLIAKISRTKFFRGDQIEVSLREERDLIEFLSAPLKGIRQLIDRNQRLRNHPTSPQEALWKTSIVEYRLLEQELQKWRAKSFSGETRINVRGWRYANRVDSYTADRSIQLELSFLKDPKQSGEWVTGPMFIRSKYIGVLRANVDLQQITDTRLLGFVMEDLANTVYHEMQHVGQMIWNLAEHKGQLYSPPPNRYGRPPGAKSETTGPRKTWSDVLSEAGSTGRINKFEDYVLLTQEYQAWVGSLSSTLIGIFKRVPKKYWKPFWHYYTSEHEYLDVEPGSGLQEWGSRLHFQSREFLQVLHKQSIHRWKKITKDIYKRLAEHGYAPVEVR